MNTRRSGFALVLVLALALASAAYAGGPGLVFSVSGVVTSASANETHPVMDGRYIAYQRYHVFDAAPNYDIWYSDLGNSGTLTAATTYPTNQQNPDLSYDRIAFDDDRWGNREVYYYDLEYKSEIRMTVKAGDQYLPRISNDNIIWYDATTSSLWYRVPWRGTNQEIPGTTGIDDADLWDIDGDTVVLTIGGRMYTWQYGSDLDVQEILSIPFSFESLKTHAGKVVYTIFSPGGYDAYVRSLNGGLPTPLVSGAPYNTLNADIFGDNVVWQNDGSGNENLSFGFLSGTGWDGIGVTAEDETAPSVFGRRVAFMRPGSLIGNDIYLGVTTPESSRTYGTDRYQTAIETSKAYFDSATSAVICTGRNFPDALTAAPFAKALKAPLLLVPGDSVPAGLEAELDRLGVTNVWIVGGEGVVSPAVETQLSAGRSHQRIAGVDRYETAKKVAEHLYDVTTMSKSLPWSGWVFVARGDAFPDALAVAPVAAAINAPILLTRTGSLPQPTIDALTNIECDWPVVLGGSDVVSDAVKDAVYNIAHTEHGATEIDRWQGADRYATAVDIVKKGLKHNWLDLDTLGIATGANFPDALGGGAALANYGSPLLLVKTGEVPASVVTFLDERPYEVGRVDIFGGSDVVNDSVSTALAAKLH